MLRAFSTAWRTSSRVISRGPRAQTDASLRVHAANVRAGNAHDGVLDRRLDQFLRVFHRLLYADHRLVQIDDHALARAPRFGDAMSPVPQTFVRNFGGDRAGLGATQIDYRQ